MERRKFLIGAGSAAVGASALVGSGAYSAMTASRDANINVVADDSGLLALQVGSGADGRVALSDTGELGIDFTSSQGGQGVNTNSRYQVGVFGDKGWAVPSGALEVADDATAAFKIINQDTSNHTVDIGYECDAEDIGNATVFFQFVHRHPEGNTYHTIGGRSGNRKITGTDTSAYLSDEGTEVPNGNHPFAPGDSIAGVLLVDTRNVTMDPSNLDLSGTLEINAQ